MKVAQQHRGLTLMTRDDCRNRCCGLKIDGEGTGIRTDIPDIRTNVIVYTEESDAEPCYARWN